MSDLIEKIGAVAAREFEAAPEWAKADLLSWVDSLPGLTDEQFQMECQTAIYNSALAQRFRGNWEHDHCRASACYHESERRKAAAGHVQRCGADGVYGSAYRRVLAEQGYRPPEIGTCDCLAPLAR